MQTPHGLIHGDFVLSRKCAFNKPIRGFEHVERFSRLSGIQVPEKDKMLYPETRNLKPGHPHGQRSKWMSSPFKLSDLDDRRE
jgi:hypothetical protein